MTFAITAIKALRTRQNGEVAFFDGAVEGRRIRIQTRQGDPLRCIVDGQTLVPMTDEARDMVAAMIDASDRRHIESEALRARKRAEAPARVEAVMEHLIRTRGITDEQIAADRPLVEAWRAGIAESVAEQIEGPEDWASIESTIDLVGTRLLHSSSPAVKRLMQGA